MEKDPLLFITLSARAFFKGVIIILLKERESKESLKQETALPASLESFGFLVSLGGGRCPVGVFSAWKQHQKGKRTTGAKESVNVIKGEEPWKFPYKLCVKEFAGRLHLTVHSQCPGPWPPDRCSFYLSRRHKGSVLCPTMNKRCCSPICGSLLTFRHLNFCVEESCLIPLVFNALPAARGMDKAGAARSFGAPFCGFNIQGLLLRSGSREINLCTRRDLQSQSRASWVEMRKGHRWPNMFAWAGLAALVMECEGEKGEVK